MRYPSPRWTAPVLLCVFLSFCILIPPASATIHNVKTECGAAGNGSTDDTAEINTCIGHLVSGDTLLFPAGTYLVSGLNRIAVSNVTVDGSSSTATLKSSLPYILPVGRTGLSATTPFTANSFDQSSTIQANFGALGVVSGDYIFIEEQPSSGSGLRGELVRAQNVSANTATLSTRVHQDYTTANSATVRKVSTPVRGLNVHDLVIDGMGSSANGMDVENVVDSTFDHITIRNVLGGQGPQGVGGALTPYLNYNVTYSNITVTGSKVFAFSTWRSGHLTFSGVSIHSLVNNGSTGSFGMGLDEVSDSTLTNITIDSTGSGGGRSFKWESAMYNVCNFCTSGHTEGAYYAAFTIEFFSAHNTFNNCSVPGTSGTGNAGIQLYEAGHANEGNNSYNTFNNCTITNTTNYPFWDHGTNNHLEINGGTFTSAAGQIGIDLGYYSATNNAYIHNVTVNGSSSIGISLDSASTGACVSNNTITGASTAIQSNSGGNIGSGNSPSNGNLTAGTCGTTSSAPAPPTGLTAAVQ